VKFFWENGILLGFLDIKEVNQILERTGTNAIVVYLSFVIGGCICMSISSNGQVFHLEPLDLKKLQSKSLNDYLKDIVMSEKIEIFLNINREWVETSRIPTPVTNPDDTNTQFKEITSNVMNNGIVSKEETLKYTPMRIAVVTCKEQDPIPPEVHQYGYEENNHIENCQNIIVSEPSSSAMSMVSGPGNTSTVTVYSDNQHFPDMFLHRLNTLMQDYGKSYSDLFNIIRPQAYQNEENPFCPPPISHPVSMMNGQHPHAQHQHQDAYPMFQEVESLRHRDSFYSEYL